LLESALRPVLNSGEVLKVGVGIDDDALDLWTATGGKLEVKGRVDIGGVGAAGGGRTRGLANLTQTVLGFELMKSKKIATSDWAAKPPLQVRQIEYAAKDAWAAAVVHKELRQRRPDLFGARTVPSDATQSAFLVDPNGKPRMERTLGEILDRRTRRREAALRLQELRNLEFERKSTADSSVGSEQGGGGDLFACVDEALEAEMRDLRGVVTSLRHDGTCFYDSKEVGIEPGL